MKNIKIILTGAQGTGKTTLNNAIKDIVSIHYPGIKIIDSMSEKFFNKDDFKDVSSKRYLEAQKKIYEYASSEYLANTSFLSSRGFADSYAYLKHSLDKTMKEDFRELISLNFKNNKKLLEDNNSRVYTFYVPIEFEIESKDLRSDSKKFQKEIDNNIKEFLEGTRTVHTTVTGSVKQRARQILRVLKINPEEYQG